MEPIHQQILAHIARHVSLTAAEQELFTSLPGIRRLLRKQFLLQAGDICRYESYVQEGCLRSFYVDDKGVEHTCILRWKTGGSLTLKVFYIRQPPR
jgi:hypothetical protein